MTPLPRYLGGYGLSRNSSVVLARHRSSAVGTEFGNHRRNCRLRRMTCASETRGGFGRNGSPSGNVKSRLGNAASCISHGSEESLVDFLGCIFPEQLLVPRLAQVYLVDP